MKKNWFVVLLTAGLSMLAIRMVGEPVVYTGLIAAYFGVALCGMLSNRLIGASTGGVIIALGLLIRRFWQEIPTFKPKKMATWTALLVGARSGRHRFGLLSRGVGRSAGETK